MDSQQTGSSSSNSRANQRGRNIFEALRNNESDEDDDFDIDHESDRSSDFSADEDEQNNFDEDWHEVTPNGEQNRVGDIPNFTVRNAQEPKNIPQGTETPLQFFFLYFDQHLFTEHRHSYKRLC